MLDSLITSKTRIKLLIKFFINSETTAYLRNLANEFGESTNGIRQELNRFEDAQLIVSETISNKKIYRANTNHPFYTDINRLILKYTGIDKMLELIISRLGNLELAFVDGDYLRSDKTGTMELILVGNNLDYNYLKIIVEKAENEVSFPISCKTLTLAEFEDIGSELKKTLLIWKKASIKNNHTN